MTMLKQNSENFESKAGAVFDKICDTIEAAGCDAGVAMGILAALLVDLAHQDGMSKLNLLAGIEHAYESWSTIPTH
jgi:hypothetical protein